MPPLSVSDWFLPYFFLAGSCPIHLWLVPARLFHFWLAPLASSWPDLPNLPGAIMPSRELSWAALGGLSQSWVAFGGFGTLQLPWSHHAIVGMEREPFWSCLGALLELHFRARQVPR